MAKENKKVIAKLSRSAVKKMTKRPGWEVADELKSLHIHKDGSITTVMKKK